MNKTSITSQLNRLDTDRLKSYRELLDFYHGRQWEGRERRGEKRLTFNYTKVFIDKIISYLMSGISFVVEAAEDRGESYFRGVEIAAVNGAILMPVNCGQQMYDVIDITDSRAGLAAAKRRVNELTLVYSPQRGEYHQRLLLGGV
jgi:hypothetical protein